MRRGTILMLAGGLLIISMVLGCATLSLGVHAGVVPEVLVWLPSRGKYQAILRVGSDDLPWRNTRQRTAINLWIHGRGTGWHIVRLVHIPVSAQPPAP